MKIKEKWKNITLLLVTGVLLALLVALFFYRFRARFVDPPIKEIQFSVPKGDKEIPIVVAFDNNYVCPALVSLCSLFENANENTYYKIYFIITDEFREDSKQKLLNLGKKYKNFGIEFLNISEKSEMFKNLKIFSDRFSKEMFYRLKIPSLLENEKKCIYMDVDTIVLKDMTELYNQNIDGYYIGGIVDGTRVAVLGDSAEKIKKRKEYCRKLNVDNMNDFINSGVILWNLEECRKANVEEKFLDFVKTSNEKYGIINDQDTFNSVCHGKIKDLPLKFNVQTYFPFNEEYENTGYFKQHITKNDWEEAKKSPVLVHYALEKPWKELTRHFFQKWWIWAKRTPSWVWDEVVEYAKFLKEEPK